MSLGIKAYIKTVSVVKTVMECPEGKLANPVAALPIITKLLLSNTSDGRGTKNKFFRKLDATSETSEAESKASHILGAYTIKIIKKDKKIEASPIWVRL